MRGNRVVVLVGGLAFAATLQAVSLMVMQAEARRQFALRGEYAARNLADSASHAVHTHDRRLVAQLVSFARQQIGADAAVVAIRDTSGKVLAVAPSRLVDADAAALPPAGRAPDYVEATHPTVGSVVVFRHPIRWVAPGVKVAPEEHDATAEVALFKPTSTLLPGAALSLAGLAVAVGSTLVALSNREHS